MTGLVQLLSAETKPTTSLRVVVAAKHRPALQAFEEEMRLAGLKSGAVELHLTRDAAKADKEDGEPTTFKLGRPDLGSLIAEQATRSEDPLLVVACGPEEFMFDVRSTAARVQMQIARGQIPLRDLRLQTEMYNW